MQIATIDLDLAKNVFQVHGVNRHGKVELRFEAVGHALPGTAATGRPSCG